MRAVLAPAAGEKGSVRPVSDEKLFRVFLNSKPQRAQCRGCGAAIEWFETLSSKKMPVNAGAVPRKSETDPATRRVIEFYASADAHWNSCSARSQFARGGDRAGR